MQVEVSFVDAPSGDLLAARAALLALAVALAFRRIAPVLCAAVGIGVLDRARAPRPGHRRGPRRHVLRDADPLLLGRRARGGPAPVGGHRRARRSAPRRRPARPAPGRGRRPALRGDDHRRRPGAARPAGALAGQAQPGAGGEGGGARAGPRRPRRRRGRERARADRGRAAPRGQRGARLDGRPGAATAEELSRSRPDGAGPRSRRSRQTGREALGEIRRLLGVLRREDEELALAPQPSLAHLADLVARVHASGLPVELDVEGERSPLPAGVDLTAYRLVQEALGGALEAPDAAPRRRAGALRRRRARARGHRRRRVAARR